MATNTTESGAAVSRGQKKAAFPLNSGRLTGSVLRRLARELGLDVSASVEDLRQIVSGKIELDGREPRNVRVELSESEEGTTVTLQDEEGVFLECTPVVDEQEVEGREGREWEDGDGEAGGGADTGPGRVEGARPERTDGERAEFEAELDRLTTENVALTENNALLGRQMEELQTEVSELKEKVAGERSKYRSLWRESLEQLREHDERMSDKDGEIETLKARLAALEARCSVPSDPVGAPGESPKSVHSRSVRTESPGESEGVPRGDLASGSGRSPRTTRRNQRTEPGRVSVPAALHRGKAPPIDPFDGESAEVKFDDWYPMLKRAATWNEWGEQETLLQLAGHLRKRALLKWNLLDERERSDLGLAVAALRERLDPGGRTTAVQDFRYARQRDSEPVGDFILRLERIFRSAYGRDAMSRETRSALLYAQLQEGLMYELMKAPAVSGAQKYDELCVAARNEEKRLVGLRRRQQLLRRQSVPPITSNQSAGQRTTPTPTAEQSQPPQTPPAGSASNTEGTVGRRCYRCGEPGHLARDCRAPARWSGPRAPNTRGGPPAGARHVYTSETTDDALSRSLLDVLWDDGQDKGVRHIRLNYRGSRPRYARVEVQGVPAQGIVDSGADITIISGELFKRVAAVAHLKKRDLKKPDRTPRTYDHRPFTLHGKMELDLTFSDTTMKTPVYIKVDAQEPLLLSEGVCRQLGIIAYHPDVLAPAVQDNPPSTASLGLKFEGAAKSQSGHERPGETEPDAGEVPGEYSTKDTQAGEVKEKPNIRTHSTDSGARTLSFGPVTHSQNDLEKR